MNKIYKSIRKFTAPPTKKFKDKKEQLKNKSILLDADEYLDEYEHECDRIRYNKIIQNIMDNHKKED